MSDSSPGRDAIVYLASIIFLILLGMGAFVFVWWVCACTILGPDLDRQNARISALEARIKS